MTQFFSQPLIQYRSGSDGEVLRDVYDIVYSPSQTDPDSANVIDLRLGSNVNGVDISLAPGRKRAVRIRGIVMDSSGQPVKGASVQAVPRVSRPVTISPTTTTDNNGVFEVDGVMQGDYLLTASFMVNNVRQTSVRNLMVEASDIENVNLVATAGFRLSGHITIDGADTDAYRVGLSNETPGAASYSNGNSPGSQFSINGISPGNYRVTFTPFNGASEPATYVKSIRFGGVESINGVLQIDNSSTGQLEISLGRNGAIAEGRVLDAQRQPAPNVMVVLVPSDSQRPDLFKTASTDLTGNFRIQGVAPGNYLVFAWPWIQNGLWLNQNFLRTVEARGTRFTVSEGANSNLELTLLPEVNF